MSDKPYQDTLHFINRHIHILDYTPVEHARWHMPVTALFLQCTEALQDDSFTVGETISHIGEIVTRVAVIHNRSSYPRAHQLRRLRRSYGMV